MDTTRVDAIAAPTNRDAPRRDLAVRALEGGSSTTKQILIDQDLRGWKEVEYEVRGRRPFDLPVIIRRRRDASAPRDGSKSKLRPPPTSSDGDESFE